MTDRQKNSSFDFTSPKKKTINHLMIFFIICFFLTSFFIAAFYYFDAKNNQIINKSYVKEGDKFIIDFKRPKLKQKQFWILNLRPGQIYLKIDIKVKDIKFITNNNEIIKTEKINNNLFQKKIKSNLTIKFIKISPKNNYTNKINLEIIRKPVFSLPLLILQFGFLFIIFFIFLFTVYYLLSIILKKKIVHSFFSKILVFQIIALFFIMFLFFIFNLNKYFTYFNNLTPSKLLTKTIVFNILSAFLLIVLFYVLSFKRKTKNLQIYLPVLVSFVFIFFNFPNKIKLSGDYILWVLNLINKSKNLFFAESLSLLLNKFTFSLGSSLFNMSAANTLIYTGKFIGVLFIFSLFIFINSLENFSYRKKLLFFILFLTFSFNSLLLGFPDFAYYFVPFLICSFLFAKKYIEASMMRIEYLITSTFLIIIAGLFHGIAFFSFPVILLLPFLKNFNTKRVSFYIKQYLAIFFSILTTFSLFFVLLKILDLNLLFNKTFGGFDNQQFISILPKQINFPQAVNFIEISYFISRGWIFFISGSFIFLILLFYCKKRISLTRSDLLLYLFGISQFVIVLFWGFDLGVRDFDLYIAPTTFIFLFLLKYFLGIIESTKDAWKCILVFSLFSPLYLFMTYII